MASRTNQLLQPALRLMAGKMGDGLATTAGHIAALSIDLNQLAVASEQCLGLDKIVAGDGSSHSPQPLVSQANPLQLLSIQADTPPS